MQASSWACKMLPLALARLSYNCWVSKLRDLKLPSEGWL